MIWVEKEEAQANRMVEILSETRARFKVMLDELRGIDEETWPDEDFQSELNKAMVAVEIANSDYKKSLAKIEAASWHQGPVEGEKAGAFDLGSGAQGPAEDFMAVCRHGLAVGLPSMVLATVLFLIFLVAKITHLI